MSELDLPLALWFYNEYIRKPYEQKRPLRRQFGFSEGRPGTSDDWELFAAILLRSGRNAGSRYGHDLAEAEVKSARVGSAFEYQYHLNTGTAKLDAEHTIDHIFVSYDDGGVTVRRVHGEVLREIFESWREPLLNNYDATNPARRQRFRRNITYGTVVRQGTVLLQIQDGVLLTPTAPTPQALAKAQARGEALVAGLLAPDLTTE